MLIGLSKIFIGIAVFISGYMANAACSAVCDPEVSKPCGLVCISKFKRCHKPTTSACMGEAGRSTKKTYENPTKVEPEQQQQSNDKAAQ